METKTSKKFSNQKSLAKTVAEPVAVYAAAPYNAYVLQDSYSLVKKSKEGVVTDIFYTFADKINFPEKKLASLLNLSPRTISNYREQHKTMEANYSEHLLKLIALFEAGKEYLGSYDEFKKWLERPFWNSNEKPEDFLNTSGGVDLVMNYLEKMAQGYPL